MDWFYFWALGILYSDISCWPLWLNISENMRLMSLFSHVFSCALAVSSKLGVKMSSFVYILQIRKQFSPPCMSLFIISRFSSGGPAQLRIAFRERCKITSGRARCLRSCVGSNTALWSPGYWASLKEAQEMEIAASSSIRVDFGSEKWK